MDRTIASTCILKLDISYTSSARQQRQPFTELKSKKVNKPQRELQRQGDLR